MTEPGTVKLVCTRDSFLPAPVGWVRWLALNADIYRLQQAMRSEGLAPPTWAEWEAFHNAGNRYCAAMRKGMIVAYSAVIPHVDEEWRLDRIYTLAKYRRMGFSKAVCTFATGHILDNEPAAACVAPAQDALVLALVESLGYRHISNCE